MDAVERGMAEIFAALQSWLVSAGAVDSAVRLAWAVLTVLWLGHVAATVRPGRDPDVVATFGRLMVAGGLLTGIGSVTRVIVTGFEALRGAGAAVLNGLIGESWGQFVHSRLVPQLEGLFSAAGGWLAYPWAMGVIAVGILLGLVLFGIGTAVYLAILFFAHLTLLVAVFLAPIAVSLLAAPSTQRWTVRWATVIVRAGLLVFTVRLIHAAVLYLAVVVPVREVSSGLEQAVGPGAASDGGLGTLVALLIRLAQMLLLMLVGTGVGVYTMLRAERLAGQFVDGVPLVEGVLSAPVRVGSQAVGWSTRSGGPGPDPNVTAEDGGGPGGPPVEEARGDLRPVRREAGCRRRRFGARGDGYRHETTPAPGGAGGSPRGDPPLGPGHRAGRRHRGGPLGCGRCGGPGRGDTALAGFPLGRGRLSFHAVLLGGLPRSRRAHDADHGTARIPCGRLPHGGGRSLLGQGHREDSGRNSSESCPPSGRRGPRRWRP